MSGDEPTETATAAGDGPGQGTSAATEEVIDPTTDGAPADADGDGTDDTANADADAAATEDASDGDGEPPGGDEETSDGEEAIPEEGASDAEEAETDAAAEPSTETDGGAAAAETGSSADAPTDAADGEDGAADASETGDRTDTADVAASEPAHDFGPDEVVPVGVKLGSTRTVIALPNDDGAGIRTISTLTCLARYDDALTDEEHVLYGEDAANQYPDRVQYMLRSGLPEDEASAETAATFFQSVVDAHALPENSAVVYAIPTIDNPRGLENLESVIEQGGIGDAAVQSYPESLCASIPAFGDDLEAISQIFIAVNMGSTNLEACAYRRGEQLAPYTTGAVTGNEVDRVIANNVEEETQGRVNVDTQTAREYKEAHADFEAFEPFTDVIQQPGGGAHEFTIERSIMDACNAYVDDAVEEFANTFLPELANDHMKVYKYALDQPIVLSGGMACIPGIVEEFQERLTAELQREVTVIAPDRPELAATVGAQRIASRTVENQ